MSYTRSLVTIAFIAMVAMILGCSGGGGSNPIAPDKTPDSTGSQTNLDSVPIIGLTDTNDTFNAVGLMGAYELTINPTDLSAELVNKRVSSIGEDYIVSGIAFFTVAPCASCLKISGITLDGGNLLLSFTIVHPFAPGNTSEDPTAKNRLDLDVFDVAAVILPTGDPAPTATTYALTGEGIYTGYCVAPDGYTTELANVITDTNALPYFLVIDDCLTEDPPAATFNRFAMGDSAEFDVAFDMAAGSLRFDMYLTMGYGASAKKLQRLTPKYYNPEFNRKAAWKVVVTPPEGVLTPAMGNTWQDNDAILEYDVTVEVYDWQIGATVSTEEDFADADPGDVFAASEPTSVTAEIPGMNTVLPEALVADDPLATGEPGDPWVFSVGIVNENLLAAGTYLGLVKVTDGRPVLTPDDGRDFIIDTEDGIVLENFEMPEYATYQTFPATVVIGCGPITLDSLTGCPDPPTIKNGDIIPFVVAGHSDNGGGTITYDVDTSYDVLDGFIADVAYPANTTGIFNVLVEDVPCVLNEHHIIAFRLTDSCTPANVFITDVCDVEITSCCSDVTITSIDFGTGTLNEAYPVLYTGVTVIGTGFDGITGDVQVIGTTIFTATNVVSNGIDTITCDIDLTGATAGTYDLYVENECANHDTETAFVTVSIPIPSPVGNVTMSVNRNTTTYGYPFSTSGAWSLAWAAPTGAVEYAIYYDNNPVDGLMNNFVFVGTTTSTSYTVPTSHLPSNHEVPGNTYIVRSRGVAGLALSEAANSEPAHIMANGWETLSVYQVVGWGNDGEGWKAASEAYPNTSYQYYPSTYGSYEAHGNRNLRGCYSYIGRYGNNYEALLRETPTVPDSSVRFIDFSVYCNGYFYYSGYNGGVIIGTCSTFPTYPWANSHDFEWAQASSSSPFHGYARDVSYVESTFDDVATSANCWDRRSSSYTQWRLGGDVNATANPSDPYIGYAFCRDNYYSSNAPRWYPDDFAIMIY